MLGVGLDFTETKDIEIRPQKIDGADQFVCFHIPGFSKTADIRTDLYLFIIFDSGFQFHHTLP